MEKKKETKTDKSKEALQKIIDKHAQDALRKDLVDFVEFFKQRPIFKKIFEDCKIFNPDKTGSIMLYDILRDNAPDNYRNNFVHYHYTIYCDKVSGELIEKFINWENTFK